MERRLHTFSCLLFSSYFPSSHLAPHIRQGIFLTKRRVAHRRPKSGALNDSLSGRVIINGMGLIMRPFIRRSGNNEIRVGIREDDNRGRGKFTRGARHSFQAQSSQGFQVSHRLAFSFFFLCPFYTLPWIPSPHGEACGNTTFFYCDYTKFLPHAPPAPPPHSTKESMWW